MKTKIKSIFPCAFAIVSALITFIPDSIILAYGPFDFKDNEGLSLLLDRIAGLIIVAFAVSIATVSYYFLARRITIRNKNCIIEIVYKDLFKAKNCKKLISFDECYTTSIGDEPEKIKPSSICGQYLKLFDVKKDDIERLLEKNDIKCSKCKSNYKKQKCYEPGTIVPNGDYLLLAFAKLLDNGKSSMTRDEYVKCLFHMWCEIIKYHGDSDVAIPILGSGIVRFKDGDLSQQELLDIMLATYKMGMCKLKKPHKLIICCKKNEDFSLKKVGDYI